MEQPDPSYYKRFRSFKAQLRGNEIAYCSKPGLISWDSITPSAHLLAENVELPSVCHILYLGCGHGASAVALARSNPKNKFWLMDISYTALKCSEQSIAVNRLENLQVSQGIALPGAYAEKFDCVLIDLPKGRKLAQRWLALAYSALHPEGVLYLCGANNQGIHSTCQDAQDMFTLDSVRAYKKGNRLLRLTKPSFGSPAASWLGESGVTPGSWYDFTILAPQGPMQVHSLPGIFSYNKLDEGTALLLDHMEISASDRVLDLGCGYGAIGMAARLAGAVQVDLVDVNLLAVAASQENLRTNHITNTSVYASDVLSSVEDRHYTCIVSNPPFHTGKDVDYQVAIAFIQQSWDALERGGRLMLVANKFIRYKKIMQDIFHQARSIAETGKYHVLLASKP